MDKVMDNKQVVKDMYAALADLPDSMRILDLIATDCVWRIPGLASYEGKQAIQDRLLLPFGQGMERTGVMELTNLVAEGDLVVAEGFARNRKTKTGKDYNNTYCTVFKIRLGKIQSVSEYCDTHLVHEVFNNR